MNKQRRQQLNQAAGLLIQARDLIEQAGEEEREYYDNMPEGIQDSEKGQKADEVAFMLEAAQEEIDTAIDGIREAAE